MRRMIELLDLQHQVTVFTESGTSLMQVDENEPEPTGLDIAESGDTIVRFGNQAAPVKIVTKGEWVFIRAFDRTFTLRIIDPVEQAGEESGGHGKTAKAPMPGTVVEAKVNEGDQVVKGQAMMIIESMKILTVIPAPRDGEVAKIHFEPGQTFEKNTVLVTLKDTEGED
jgi:acetyl/propionyl-CoA carboxylase alpha subunit